MKSKKKRKTYVKIDDTCDIGNMEFVTIKRLPAVDSMSFVEFGTILTTEAKKFWKDVLQFSQTYYSKKMFEEHSNVWKYYEQAKDVESDDEESDDEDTIVVDDNKDQSLLSNDAIANTK